MFTAILAVSTIGLWIVTWRAAEAGNRTAVIAEQALVADKRAFVFASGMNTFYYPHQAPGGTEYWWRFRPWWFNSGDTPTRNLQLSVNAELRTTQLPRGFNFDAGGHLPGTGMLGPHSGSNGGLCPPPDQVALSVADIEDMIAERKYFYMWGSVRYLDTFPKSKPHLTRFCWQVVPIGDPRAFHPERQTVSFSYIHWTEGNCADDECG